MIKLFTQYGLEKQAQDLYSDVEMTVAQIVIGDANGEMYEPSAEQTELVNQRAALDIIEINADGNTYQFFAKIPADTPSFTIREIGLKDDLGGLLWISQCEMDTVIEVDDAVTENIIGVQIEVTQGTTIATVDGNIQMASKDYVHNNFQHLSKKGAASGYCPLNAEAKVPKEHLPNISASNPYCIKSGNTDAQGNLDLVDAQVAVHTDIEYTEANTYTFTLSSAGTYSVALVGGGAGGWAFNQPVGDGVIYYRRAGGSGAGFVGELNLQAGTYTVTVGKGGTGVYTNSNSNQSVTDATATTLSFGGTVLVSAGGGYATGGVSKGGNLTLNVTPESSTLSTNGNDGATSNSSSEIDGAASVYQGYGAGGRTRQNGTNGYFSIQISLDSSTVVDYKVSANNPLVINDASGNSQTITAVNSDTITGLADGTYNKFIDANGSELLKNNLFYSSQTPAGVPNVDIIGEVTNYNGILSGFSKSSYAQLNSTFNPQTSPWEIVLKIKTPAVWAQSAYQPILGNSGEYGFGLQFSTTYPGCLYTYLSSNGTSWDISGTSLGGTALNPNTDYWVKLEFTGTNYVTSISTDGETYTEYTSVTSSSSIASTTNTLFGINRTLANFFRGSINLNETYIKVNDTLWWSGMQPVQQNDVWAKIGEPYEVFKYDGSDWQNYNKVPVASLVILNGNLENYQNAGLYDNKFNVTEFSLTSGKFVVETFQSGKSWYRVWSDGWCEQGGVTSTYNTSIETISLLKTMKDTNYLIMFSEYLNSSDTGGGSASPILSNYPTDVTTTSFIISKSSGYYIGWKVEGYIA